ncbi:agmatinase [Desulfacinum hydrothermale]|uniref:agmatinase n=1 Tax=Desulfacinum hydrothermale TaxID=109258 RepID=UPI001BAEA6D9|nr:agmatinase [Desulfacinum hydrothermale]
MKHQFAALSQRFRDALGAAFDYHHRQVRKGSHVPYVSHLLAVGGLVLENGGDEDVAVAALLHDAAEDQGGEDTLEAIRVRFGERVAGLVRACSDCLQSPKPPWRERKEAYLARLETAPADAVLITLADKVHNARTIVADLEREGASVWTRFRGGKSGTLWYYKSLVHCFRRRGRFAPLVRELTWLVHRLQQLGARVTVLGVPFDAHSSHRRGPALAPGRIREALHSGSMNLTAESGLDLRTCDGWADAGDLSFSRTDSMVEKVQEAVAAIVKRGGSVLALGGDHSITVPVVRAVAAHHGPLNILHLDAHPDLYPALDGNPMSHGSPFARILEEGLAQRLVQVGIRTMNAEQKRVAERYGVEVLPSDRWRGPQPMAFEGPVYLSLDVDCLDPAYAPGVSHHEPGGLSPRDVMDLIAGIRGRLVGADLVEINPERDPLGITAAVGAKLLKEILARMLTQAEGS